MAIYGQGAPGVRIKLRDQSETNLVLNPNIVGGIVGYSAKGEFNKILDITSNSQIDTILGNGFNNSKYNQGLYATRAIVNAGGFVEFVRPFGEAVITDDTDPDYNTNQKLKTDTFLVQYDYNTSTITIDTFVSSSGEAVVTTDDNHGLEMGDTVVIADVDVAVNGTQTITSIVSEKVFTFATLYVGTATTGTVTPNVNSIDIDYYAATRYITDGLTGIGEREIYRIQEVISENATTNFVIDSDETATDKIPLFAIMNLDPTSSTRAADKLTISIIDGVSGNTDVTTIENHGLAVGDEVTIGGTVNYNGTFTVDEVATDKLFRLSSGGAFDRETTGVVFVNEDTVDSGVDALRIKTVASGSASKIHDYLKFFGTALTITDGQTIILKQSDGTSITYEFDSNSSVTSGNISVEIAVAGTFNSKTDVIGSSTDTITLTNSIVSVGDVVRIFGSPTLLAGLSLNTNYVVKSVSSGVIQLSLTSSTTAIDLTPDGTGETITLMSVTETINNFIDALVANSDFTGSMKRSSITGGTGYVTTTTITVDDPALFSVGDKVVFTSAPTPIATTLPTGITENTIYLVSAIDNLGKTMACTTVAGVAWTLTADTGASTGCKVANLTTSVGNSIAVSSNNSQATVITTYGLNVPATDQVSGTTYISPFTGTTLSVGSITKGANPGLVTATDEGIVLDSTVGRTFLTLGLATEDYVDTNFDGTKERVYTLNAAGLVVAKIYLYVDYFFNGETYSFSGTLIPYVLNDLNLYIVDAATAVEDGWKFVINENAALEAATEVAGFDLSQTVDRDNLIQSTFSDVSFNSLDPAVLNDAIWSYDPANNNTTTILSSAWELFVNKDRAAADMLVSAGTAISNLFVRGLEQINYTVMDAMLNVCEKRKDMFCVFDGVDEKKIEKALEKMVGIGGEGDIARWGGIWDGRSIFNDTVYTKISTEVVKSIEVAAVITQNRAGNAWWIPPAGLDQGRIPGSLAARQKYERTYNYAEDANSDIAKLYDANINPTRVNVQGQILYGQKTMLKKNTALSRMNVIMLVAGVHKRFANYLEKMVFKLNTPALRASITSDLQAQLDSIKSSNPSGLTLGIVYCNDENNTSTIIDTNQLIVDVVLQPTRSSEFITLRTTIQRTGDDSSKITSVTIL